MVMLILEPAQALPEPKRCDRRQQSRKILCDRNLPPFNILKLQNSKIENSRINEDGHRGQQKIQEIRGRRASQEAKKNKKAKKINSTREETHPSNKSSMK
jgi:hypothetical protein